MIVNTTNTYMPWAELIQAFMFDLPNRMRREKIVNLSGDPMFALREFRVLTIGGARQCGKTQTAFQTVRENISSRLMGTRLGGFPSLPQNDEVLRSRLIEQHQLDEYHLKGVKLLVIDHDGRHDPNDDPYATLEEVYRTHPDWFDPDFSVVRIL